MPKERGHYHSPIPTKPTTRNKASTARDDDEHYGVHDNDNDEGEEDDDDDDGHDDDEHLIIQCVG